MKHMRLKQLPVLLLAVCLLLAACGGRAQAASYGWIDLDDERLAKLDQHSAAEVR